MILLNYILPDHSYIPQEIYDYTNNERMLLILFGNVIIQTLKTNLSLKNETQNTNEAIDPLIKEMTNKYTLFLKEKDTVITELEAQKKHTIELYNDLFTTERNKLDIEIKKEVSKEKQHMEEKLQFMKENYENNILSLKTEKENINQRVERLKQVETEYAILEEKYKNNTNHIDDIVEKEILRLENVYKTKEFEQLEYLQKENSGLKTEIQNMVHQVEKEKYDALTKNYENKENAMTELQKTIEEIRRQTSKTSVSQDKGKVGELYFFELVNDLFQHMDGFEMEDKTKVGHMGDYLMKFKEGFSIMVDCKNFNKSKVGIVDIKKFKSDIKSHQYIRFAWMVSLNKGISNYDKYPIDFEFENGVLYCYINSLFLWDENQKNIIISCWLFCKEIYLNFFDKENADTEKIITLMKRDNNKKLIAENGRRKIKDMKSMTEQLKVTIYELEKDLIEIIKGDILMQNEDRITSLKTWWSQLLIRDDSKKNKIETEVVYNKFKESLDELEQTDLNYDEFLLNLKTFLNEDDFTKNKTKGAKKYILNYKWGI